MKTALILAAAALTFGVGAANPALADDPCHGYDIACDGDDCLVCWPDGNSSVDVVCEEASLVEVQVTLPGCVGAPAGMGLIAPDGGLDIPDGLRLPELTGTGGRTVVPVMPEPMPQPQRDPVPPTAAQ